MLQPLSPAAIRVDSGSRTTPATNNRVEAAYRQHSAKMWRALLAYSGNPDIASDAVAEAFAQALHRNNAIRHVDRWVWRAAFRIAAGQLKERSRFSPQIDSPAPCTESPVDLSGTLTTVSPNQRASLFLYYYGGYPPREIAHMIGSTQSAVRVHLHRGRKRLAEILDGGCHD